MTTDDLKALWRPILDSLLVHARLISDDLEGLDQPLWQGVFQAPDGPREEAAMPLRQLLVHLNVATWEVPMVMVSGEGFGPVKDAAAQLADARPSALTADLEQRAERLLEMLNDLDDAVLAHTRMLPFGELTIADALTRAALHVMHHKAQLMVVMRQLGVRPARFL
jgi:uncharacterized damage-inducible protein DinB